MRHNDPTRYDLVTISRHAVRLCCDRVTAMLDDPAIPDPAARAVDTAFRQALTGYLHRASCHEDHCRTRIGMDSIQARLDRWIPNLVWRPTGRTAEQILDHHPTTLGFLAVLTLYDMVGGSYENALVVLGDEAPFLLGHFSPNLPITPDTSLGDTGRVWFGARGFG